MQDVMYRELQTLAFDAERDPAARVTNVQGGSMAVFQIWQILTSIYLHCQVNPKTVIRAILSSNSDTEHCQSL